MGYNVKGQLLEVCTCNILCPCWVGEDPDGGTCDGVWRGITTKAVSMALTSQVGRFVILTLSRSNILKGNWRIIVAYVDDGASDDQRNALLDMWARQTQQTVADLAGLIGEILGVEQVPITFDVQAGKGRLKIGETIKSRTGTI